MAEYRARTNEIIKNLENDSGIPFNCATTSHQFLFDKNRYWQERKMLSEGK